MRVLLVSDVDPLAVIGGGERLLAGHAHGLAGLGHEVVVCSGAPGAPGVRAGVHVLRMGRNPGTPARAAGAVRSLRPDIVIGYQPACALGALREARRLGIPAIYVFSSSWPEEHATRRRRPGRAGIALRRSVERACLRASDGIVVLSRYSAEKVRAVLGAPGTAVRLVPGGVDPRRFAPNGGPEAARGRLGLPEGGPLLLAVRNLVPRMGLDNLLAAMPSVLRASPGALLVLAGGGPLRPSLEALTSDLGIAHCVRFAGFVPEELLPDYYRAAAIAVVPTRELEGFGLATVEALACGTPVVGTPVGATPEILAPLDPELVAPGTSPTAIAAGIVRLLERGPDGLRERARRYVLARYTWEVAAARLEAVIEEAAR